mmetsp:Transcript_37844/g.96765  ORF Transcript_37844/g.96765 Transcript_37844/m.96765 type:complete len:237 (+) Transcript_37844:1264-1974(+)
MSWIPLICAILTWLAAWQARFPSASVHFCMHPPLRMCVCVARTISSTPPSWEMRSWIAELLHARLPRAEHPISCTSTLSRCACIPEMMASMPPAAATEFCSSALPHTRFLITCIPSTCTRTSCTQARSAETICSGSPFSLLRARVASELSTADLLAAGAPSPRAPPSAPAAYCAVTCPGMACCWWLWSFSSSLRNFLTWMAVSWRSSPLRSSSVKSRRSLPHTPLDMKHSIFSWGM